MLDRAKKNPKIEILTDSVVEEVLGDGKNVNGVRVKNIKTQQEKTIPLNGVFIAIGHIPNTDFLKGQVKTDEEGFASSIFFCFLLFYFFFPAFFFSSKVFSTGTSSRKDTAQRPTFQVCLRAVIARIATTDRPLRLQELAAWLPSKQNAGSNRTLTDSQPNCDSLSLLRRLF
jgi:hypothetical protein